jgi:hypothetical protein
METYSEGVGPRNTTTNRGTTMTTTAKATPRQTAGNNAFLAQCKRLFNAPINARVRDLLNTQGEAAAREYLLRNVVRTLSF